MAQVGATKAARVDAAAAYVDVAGFFFKAVKKDNKCKQLVRSIRNTTER